MSFDVLAFSDIKTNLLRDISNALPNANTGSDSDFGIRANGTASAGEGLYQYISWAVKQIFPDTADSDYLERHAKTRGLSRKAGVVAAGTIQLTGSPGAPVSTTLTVQTTDGRQYQITGTGSVGSDGTLTLAASASDAGSSYNADAGTSVTLLSPPAYITAAGTIVSMVGGTDDETDAELLVRLLDVIQRPPAGGNAFDFRRWALDCDGVSNAYVYPLRRGLGTVDIVITASGGLPSATTIATVQAYIDSMRPVTAKSAWVLAPTIVTIDHQIQIAYSTTLSECTSQINTNLATYFDTLVPGDTYIRSQAEAIVSNTTGVTDRLLVTPTANISPEVDATVVQWLQLGNVSVSDIS